MNLNENKPETTKNTTAVTKNQSNTDTASLDEREKLINQREMVLRAKELLTENSLPAELADVLKYDSEDALKKAISTLRNIINANPSKNKENDYKILGNNRLPDTNEYSDDSFGLRKAFALN